MDETSSLTLPAGISLRPETPEDRDFLFRLYASTREDELAPVLWTAEQKGAFLKMQFDAQFSHYRKHYADAAFEVIQDGVVPIGRLYVHRTAGTINVMDIALLPARRRQGLGSTLLRQVLDEGRQHDKVVQIYVEQNNPALKMYLKLGFVQTGLDGIYIAMEWSASRAQQ